MNKLNIYSVALGLLAFLPASAQELHESVSVEGTYKPDIIKAERFNVFPRPLDFEYNSKPLQFDTRGVCADFIPRAASVGIDGWQTSRPAAPRGYLDLTLGSWLNSSLSAGYSPIRSANTTLDISLQHNSTSLWKPYVDSESKRFRYDESIAANFSHIFDRQGILSADLQYHFGYFDYYSFLPPAVRTAPQGSVPFPEAPTQTVNDVAFRAGWTSRRSSTSVWDAGLSVRHFAYRALYLSPTDVASYRDLRAFKGDRETELSLFGSGSLDWDSGSEIGFDADLRMLLYAKAGRGGVNIPLPSPDNYGIVTLTPYYRFTRDRLIVNVGAVVDLTFNAMGDTRDTHYPLFHIAPDVRVDYRGSGAAIYLHAGGGSRLRTLASQAYTEYYGMPALASTQPRHIPIDAVLGADFGPFSGFSAGASVGFRYVGHEWYQGWYPTLLNYNGVPCDGLDVLVGAPSYTPYYSLATATRNVKGFRAELHAAWQYSNWLTLRASCAWYSQSGSLGWVEDCVQSRWRADASAEVHPWRKLTVGVDFKYRGHRRIAVLCENPAPTAPSFAGERENTTSERFMALPHIANLGAVVRWDFSPRFSLGVRADNILNRRASYLPCLPSEGIDVNGTVSIRF